MFGKKKKDKFSKFQSLPNPFECPKCRKLPFMSYSNMSPDLIKFMCTCGLVDYKKFEDFFGYNLDQRNCIEYWSSLMKGEKKALFEKYPITLDRTCNRCKNEEIRLEFYCDNCKEHLCGACAGQYHKGHKLEGTREGVTEAQMEDLQKVKLKRAKFAKEIGELHDLLESDTNLITKENYQTPEDKEFCDDSLKKLNKIKHYQKKISNFVILFDEVCKKIYQHTRKTYNFIPQSNLINNVKEPEAKIHDSFNYKLRSSNRKKKDDKGESAGIKKKIEEGISFLGTHFNQGSYPNAKFNELQNLFVCPKCGKFPEMSYSTESPDVVTLKCSSCGVSYDTLFKDFFGVKLGKNDFSKYWEDLIEEDMLFQQFPINIDKTCVDCKEEPKNDINYFCYECQKHLCIRCSTELHVNHQIFDLTAAVTNEVIGILEEENKREELFKEITNCYDRTMQLISEKLSDAVIVADPKRKEFLDKKQEKIILFYKIQKECLTYANLFDKIVSYSYKKTKKFRNIYIINNIIEASKHFNRPIFENKEGETLEEKINRAAEFLQCNFTHLTYFKENVEKKKAEIYMNRHTKVFTGLRDTFCVEGRRVDITCVNGLIGNRIILGRSDGFIGVYNESTFDLEIDFQGHNEKVTSFLGLSRNLIVSSGEDKKICIWKYSHEEKFLKAFHQANQSDPLVSFIGHDYPIIKLLDFKVYSNNLFQFISFSGSEVKVWEFKEDLMKTSTKCVQVFTIKVDFVAQVVLISAIVLKDDRLATISIENKVRFWDVLSGESKKEITEVHSQSPNSIMLYGDDRFITGKEGTIFIVNYKTNSVEKVVNPKLNEINSIIVINKYCFLCFTKEKILEFTSGNKYETEIFEQNIPDITQGILHYNRIITCSNNAMKIWDIDSYNGFRYFYPI